MNKKIMFVLIVFAVILINPIYAIEINENASKTYTDLNTLVNQSENTLNLNDNYTFNQKADIQFSEGVKISKNITIIGKNTSIDGNCSARGLVIESNCNVILENLTFKNGFSKNRGGAILLKTGSNLTVKNCIFENNNVYNSNGGALCCRDGTYIEIRNCIFTNNTSIRESNLEWDKFKRGMGSAICVGIDSDIKVYNSIFKNNNAYLSTILVISFNDKIHKLSKLYVKNCSFENNTSQGGSVIYLDELGVGEFIDSTFTNNNKKTNSGALLLDSPIYALVKNCLFSGNYGKRGAAICIKPFNNTVSNVDIIDCEFIQNHAEVSGGAIYSNNGNLNIKNSKFNQNTANKHGGGIYAVSGEINISYSIFNKNMAETGGALSIQSDKNHIINTRFTQNTAGLKGGAIHSKSINIISSNCNYLNNNALKCNSVYGALNVEISKINSYFGCVKLKISLTSPWKMPLSQNIKLKFIGSKNYETKWLKTDQNGILNLKVPLDLKIGTYQIETSIENAYGYTNPITVTVLKTPIKLDLKKFTTSYKSGKELKFHIINKKTKMYVSGAKVTVKFPNGQKITLKSDENGLVKFNTYKFPTGKFKISVFSKDKNIRLSVKKSEIIVKKAPAKFEYHTDKNHLIIKVRHKTNGKILKKFSFTVKITNGKKIKTLKIKTDSNGIMKVKLLKGKNKVAVKFKNRNYNIYKRFNVKC